MFSVSPSSASTPFTVAQTRVAECVVAAVAVAGVNVLLSVSMTARRYYSERVAVLRSVGAEMRAVIEAARARRAASAAEPEDPHAGLAALAQAVLALDQMRAYVRFEYPAFGPFDRLAQRMDRDLLALTSTLSSLHTPNHLRIVLPTFAQFALGIYGAVAVAMLAFALIVERDPEPRLRRQLRDIFKELARGLHGSRERFEWRIHDRLNQLALPDWRAGIST